MEAPELERQLAAILAADVEGYSRLMHADEEATMATLSARRMVIDDLISEHRGRIANTAGDSVLAEFASVLDAVSCALEIQKALVQANQDGASLPMRLRIGINVGDVMVKDGDIFGDGVNVAARLEGLVKGGEICVSRGVRDHLRHRGGMIFEDLGEQRVKNIAHPIRAFRLRLDEDASGQEILAPDESIGASDESIDEVEAPSAPAESDEISADQEVALELALWESVKDGSAAELELLSRAVSARHFRRAGPNPPRCRSEARTAKPADELDPGSGRRPSRPRLLGIGQEQRPPRGARSLSGSTPEWAFRWAGPGAPSLSARRPRLPRSAAVAALAFLKRADRPQKIDLAQRRP